MKKEYYAQPLLNGIILKKDNYECCSILKDNNIIIKKSHSESNKQFDFLMNIPFVRGIIVTVNYFTSFIASLNNSAEYINEEVETYNIKIKNTKIMKAFNLGLVDAIILIALLMSFVISFALFLILPSFISYLISFISSNELLLNLTETTFRIVIFYFFLGLSSRIKKIRIMYKYHGAFHKIQNCVRNGQKLTLKNIKENDIYSYDCGLGFIFSSAVLYLYLLSFLQAFNIFPFSNIARIILFLLFSGIIYEIYTFLNYKGKGLYIGRMFEETMVLEPDDIQLKVALSAFNTLRKEKEVNNTSKNNNE